MSNCRRVGPRASSTAPDGDSTPKYAREYIPGPTLRGKTRVGPAPPSSQLPGQPPPRAEHVGIAAPDRDAALPTATTAAHWAPPRHDPPRPPKRARIYQPLSRPPAPHPTAPPTPRDSCPPPRRRHGDAPRVAPSPSPNPEKIAILGLSRLHRFLFSSPPTRPDPVRNKPTNATEEAEAGGREKGEIAAAVSND